ncbi:NYN domain-containing protein [Pseudomonas aeruginosa]|uniref:LabA-like NYN domain-containing protein n=1 Tax=Pseudomonas aeruginosa TaxID=287 RepID=UPI000EB40F2A|nr:NYN domain-containing protein [Pseudomonas aeruginosa]RPS57348.1 nuclease [Pseudomonas aeruginosa]RQF67376.1 nuclease [Pseudomonas aeruginosa]HCD6630365.1 NYN domain-containing protein [Pseudomonas aeruginosa]HCU2050306.1 NYN domain-containing protein [Pseudomonas aeruginosa]
MSRPESPAAKKIAVFADVQNLYYTVRQAYGCHLNYAALWADIARGGSIVEAYAYAIDRGDPRQQQFQQILRNLGFTVKLKPYIQRADGSAKGDWDVGITIDVLDAAPRVDEVVLLSGDGDFDLLLEKVIRTHGVVATAYGVPGLTANVLIRAASRYVPIEGGLLLKG